VIDGEVARLLREAEQAALSMLRAHTDDLTALVDLLQEHETIDGSQVYQLLGRPVPGGPQSPLTAAHRSNGDSLPVAVHAHDTNGGSQPCLS
jgi:cell division protease FtsH